MECKLKQMGCGVVTKETEPLGGFHTSKSTAGPTRRGEAISPRAVVLVVGLLLTLPCSVLYSVKEVCYQDQVSKNQDFSVRENTSIN